MRKALVSLSLSLSRTRVYDYDPTEKNGARRALLNLNARALYVRKYHISINNKQTHRGVYKRDKKNNGSVNRLFACGGGLTPLPISDGQLSSTPVGREPGSSLPDTGRGAVSRFRWSTDARTSPMQFGGGASDTAD